MRRSAPTTPNAPRTLWFALLLTLTNGFMDAHTYYVRGGVFANVQTGNVIFFAIDASERKLSRGDGPRLAHPGVHRRRHVGRPHQVRPRRTRRDAIRCAGPWPYRRSPSVVIGFVPATVPHSYVTVPIAFLAAVQMGLFRNIGDLAYLPVATTGNLMRFVEAGYDGFVEKHIPSRRASKDLRHAHPGLRRGSLDRRLHQPGLGRARDLAGGRHACRHAGPVHRRRAGAAVTYLICAVTPSPIPR